MAGFPVPVCAGVCGIVLFRAYWEDQILDFGQWLAMCAFPVMAWPLRGDLRRVYAMLGLAAAGLWLGMLRTADWHDLLAFRTGYQTGFLMAAGPSGLISATVLLGLLLFSERLLGSPASTRGCLARWLGLMAAAYLSAYILVASQTRSAWLVFALLLPFLLGFQHTRLRSARRSFPGWWPYAFTGGLLAAGVVLNSESILSRIAPDREVAADILSGDSARSSDAEEPASSFGPRYHALAFGAEKWLERPFLGWGTGSVTPLIQNSRRPELFLQQRGYWLPSLHNTVLEVLVCFGLLGAVLLGFGGWLLGKAVAGAELRNRLPGEFLLFLMGAAAILGVGFLTGSRFLNEYWRSSWLLVMAGLYTFILHPAGKPAAAVEEGHGIGGPV